MDDEARFAGGERKRPGKRLGTGRQRLVALLAAAAGTATALLAAFSWPELATRRFLRGLRQEPASLSELIVSEDRRAQEAVRCFLEERAGKEALLRLYLREFDRPESGFALREWLPRMRELGTREAAFALRESGYAVERSGGGLRNSFSVSAEPPDRRRRLAILEHLGACAGDTFHLDEMLGIELQIQPVRPGAPIRPEWPGEGWPPEVYDGLGERARAEHVCFLRYRDR
jgi:hypothetical protein